MARVDQINNPHIRLCGVLAMQPTCVLLQRALPRYRHRQYQGVQRRMIEAFAHQLACGEQNAWRLRREFIELSDHLRALFLGHSAMQHGGLLYLACERGEDRI